MKYDIKYSNLELLEEKDDIIRSRISAPCVVCGQQTPFVEICSEAHFCSEECCNDWYREYFETTGGPCQAEDFIEGEE